jgi:hypothetical protein
VSAWRAAEVERGQPRGMMHDHYCSDCGSECSEDFEDCVLGTRTKCEECRTQESYSHEHSCPLCRRSWSCVSRTCMGKMGAVCGDCPAPQAETSPRYKVRFSALSLMSAVSSLGTLVGFTRLPYDFYTLLRIVLCLAAAVGFARAFERKSRTWQWMFGAAVIVYNPLLPIHLHSKSAWEVINSLTVSLLWVAAYKLERRV